MVTHKQRRLLRAIASAIAHSGVAPSFEEMREAVGLKSKSGIHRLVGLLEERGLIRRIPNRARALEILPAGERLVNERPSPAATSHYPSNKNAGPHPQIAEPTRSFHSGDELLMIPMLGKIAAGHPIEAVNNSGTELAVPASMLGRGEHFGLVVRGDSMTGDGILDGDLAIAQRALHADQGEIVVALIDDEEATLKRLKRQNDIITLVPSNPHYPTINSSSHRIFIQGILSTIIRNFDRRTRTSFHFRG